MGYTWGHLEIFGDLTIIMGWEYNGTFGGNIYIYKNIANLNTIFGCPKYQFS
jgi:hypothetical protein